MIKVNLFNNLSDADLLDFVRVPGVNYYRLYSDLEPSGGVDYGENNILYEAGNSMVGYNYFLGRLDGKTGKFNSVLNWISKERLVYEY